MKLKDIAEVICKNEIKSKLENITLLNLDSSKNASFAINILDIIKKIVKVFPDYQINNIGDFETLVEYYAKKNKENKFLEIFKLVLVSCILFIGSSTAIISFHNEVQLIEVFEIYAKMFFKNDPSKSSLLNFSYSVGLCLGIIVFYNHIFGKKLTQDPTPIEVELSLHEQDIIQTKLDILNTNKNNGDSNIC